MKKMLSSICASLALAASVMLAGCAGQTQTPAQQAAVICPIIQTGITALQADVGLATGTQAVLTKAAPIVSAACTNIATVQATDVTSLVNFAVETLIPFVQQTDPRAAANLIAAQIIFDIYNAAHPTVTPVTPTTVAPSPTAQQALMLNIFWSDSMAAARMGAIPNDFNMILGGPFPNSVQPMGMAGNDPEDFYEMIWKTKGNTTLVTLDQ